MGGGTSGLFPSTKGAKPHQMSMTPNPISVRRRGPTYYSDDRTNVGAGGIGGGGGSIARKNRIRLLTPSHVLKKCLHWRIGAIGEGDLIRWIQGKLADSRYHMVPSQLRSTLIKYVSELKATRPAGKGYDIVAFLSVVTRLEEKLEAMKKQ